ncbi:putative lambda repressor-like DNA-binding protein [Serratia phage Parlo]|uniref:Putative lambda repressor-like DNA-binding protein n=1 Tax=Serratia phage Parlo TaxID=2557554 RepID=A0A482MFH4_9CAUD|nr:putative lambda repressor-like DNA-binding protein [Serratia phage Parlo]QBQ72165.1 putative lambda repressor-like DNA-binding protein [Serratia phage Parlo]
MVNKRFFDDLMSDKRLSLRSIAKRMDMLPSQLSLTLNGKRRMQIAEAVKLSQILGAPLAELMIAAGIEEAKQERRRVTVIGHINGEGQIIPAANGSVDRVMLPDGLPDECVALQYRTADTQISFTDGWLMFSLREKQDPNEVIGCFCRAKIVDGPEVVGTVRRGYESGTFNVSIGLYSHQSIRLEWAAKILITLH